VKKKGKVVAGGGKRRLKRELRPGTRRVRALRQESETRKKLGGMGRKAANEDQKKERETFPGGREIGVGGQEDLKIVGFAAEILHGRLAIVIGGTEGNVQRIEQKRKKEHSALAKNKRPMRRNRLLNQNTLEDAKRGGKPERKNTNFKKPGTKPPAAGECEGGGFPVQSNCGTNSKSGEKGSYERTLATQLLRS